MSACYVCHGRGYERLENSDGTVCLSPCPYCRERTASDNTAERIERDRAMLHSLAKPRFCND